MNKVGIIALVACVVVGVVIIANNQQQSEEFSIEQAAQTVDEQAASWTQEAKKAADETTAQAQQKIEEAKKAAAEAEQQAKQEAAQAEELAKKEAEDWKAKIQALLAKAQEDLEAGKYDQAIQSAQKVLLQDANSNEAKGIISTAKAEIQKLAQEKLTGAAAGEATQAVEGVKSALGGIGQ